MDWLFDGPVLWSFAKVMTVSAGAVAALMAPFVIIAQQNAEALNQNFDRLDQRPSIVFNSAAQCVKAGYPLQACESAQQRAVGIGQTLGTSVSYDSNAACRANHGPTCRAETVLMPITTMVGQVPVTNYIPTTTYQPPIVAWQAARDGLRDAVPLYPGPQGQDLMRRDGTVFAAPAP